MRAVLALSTVGLLMGAGLPDAARSGDKAAVRALLAKGADVHAAEGDGSTALLWAAYQDDLETVELLLRAGAKVNAANDLGVTPLWAASQNGNAAMVRRLLAGGANPNAALVAGETPLMVAARSGYAEVAELLLAKGANANARATRAQTPLMWAASRKHPAVVQVLLSHGADVRARSEEWSQMMAVPPHGYAPYNKMIPHGGETALLFAARSGDLESAKLLLAAGANVNDADAWGVSATTLAAHSGFGELVAFLLEKGADPNAAPAGFTALHEAIARRDEAMVAALLAHGANANTPLKTWTPTRRSSKDFSFAPGLVGATPYWLAARFLEPGVMRLLVKHGADPKVVHVSHTVAGESFQPRSEASTAVMAALGVGGGTPWVAPAAADAERLRLETVKAAVELGADVHFKNAAGRTALDTAKTLKAAEVVTFLTGRE